jgi:thiopurine S-methyltransferase
MQHQRYTSRMSTEWHERWEEGRIGFHSETVHSDLLSFGDRFLGGGKQRVLVPLCGKTLDLRWLAEAGHDVVGIELVEQAVRSFFDESGLSPEVEDLGAARAYRANNVTILCGNIFDLEPAHVGEIGRIWDRAALVALPPEMRGRYVEKLRTLVGPGTRVLQNCFDYDQSLMSGPPFSVPDEEVRKHYQGCTIELLKQRNVIDDLARWRELGHSYWNVRTYLIETC